MKAVVLCTSIFVAVLFVGANLAIAFGIFVLGEYEGMKFGDPVNSFWVGVLLSVPIVVTYSAGFGACLILARRRVARSDTRRRRLVAAAGAIVCLLLLVSRAGLATRFMIPGFLSPIASTLLAMLANGAVVGAVAVALCRPGASSRLEAEGE